MANVSHASLTGSQLHEPKGASTAATGQVYVSDGLGSGSWTTVTGISFTGMVADFLSPIAPAGWLELDGSTISTTTYAALYNAVTIQRSGTRGAGAAVITGLSTTTGIKVGYYVFGTGITAGTTVLSVDGASQITMTANASSSGTATVVFSPWALNTGTITLPDLTTAGRFRRSRSASTNIGTVQADSFKAHSHTGTTSGANTAHTHTGVTGTESVAHGHPYDRATVNSTGAVAAGGSFAAVVNLLQTSTVSGAESAVHVHSFTTDTENVGHSHTYTTDSPGGSETRPLAVVFMTCVKT